MRMDSDDIAEYLIFLHAGTVIGIHSHLAPLCQLFQLSQKTIHISLKIVYNKTNYGARPHKTRPQKST